MEIFLSKNFIKGYKKLRSGEKKKFKERRDIFLNDPSNPLLNNHALHGKYMGYRSIAVAGDLRIIYKFLDKNAVLFAEIGSHNKLYS